MNENQSVYPENAIEINNFLSFVEVSELKILDILPDIFVITDLSGNIQFLNKTGLKEAGIEKMNEIVGENIFSMIDQEDFDRAYENTKLMLNGPLGTNIYKLSFPKRTSISLEVNGDLLRQPDGTPYGLFYVCRIVEDRLEMEKALIESEKRNKAMIEGNPDLMLVISKDGYFVDYKSTSFEALYVPPEVFLGKHISEVFPSELAVLCLSKVEEVFITNNQTTYEYDLNLDKLRQFEARVVPYGENQVLVIVREMTELKNALEESRINQERMNALYQLSNMQNHSEKEIFDFALEEGIRLTNSKIGYLHFINKEFKSLQLITWSNDRFVKSDTIDEKNNSLFSTEIWADCYRFQQPIIDNNYLKNSNGNELAENQIPLSKHLCIPVMDGENVVGIAGVGNKDKDYDNVDSLQLSLLMNALLKIINQKRVEEKIIRLNEDLERKVIQRTSELNDALSRLEHSNVELTTLNEAMTKESTVLLKLNDRLAQSEELLKNANETKDKFISIIAHDLKNPLQGLLLSSELLVQYGDAFDKTKTAQKHIQINKLTKDLSSLLENLLTWSRAQSGRIDFEPEMTDLKVVINDCMNLFHETISAKKLDFRIDTSTANNVFVDRNLVKTIFRNLISNAVKFTEENGKIDISTKGIEDKVQISIKDSGIGISKEDISKLFKIDVSNKEIGNSKEKGTGLGLILCKEFVEKHGGEISVQSTLGEGTTFRFTLPLVLSSKIRTKK